MKKTVIYLICWILGICNCHALIVKSIDELKNDISARTSPRYDENGDKCAILKVRVPDTRKIDFVGSIVGDIQVLPGEYTIYIKPGTTGIQYEYDGESVSVDFSKFGIDVNKQSCYRMILDDESSNVYSPTSAYITANYDNMVVLIDGIPVGETPLRLETISPGKHTIAVPNISGITMNDTIVDIIENQENKISLSLIEQKEVSFKIDWNTQSPDSYGWYIRWGINKIESNGKEGIQDYTGNIIVPCEFDHVSMSDWGNYYKVGNSNPDKPGYLIDGVYEVGKGIIVPLLWDNIISYGSNNPPLFKVCKNGKWGFVNTDGEIVIAPIYEDIEPVEKGLFYFEKDRDKRGFVDLWDNEFYWPKEFPYTCNGSYAVSSDCDLIAVRSRGTLNEWGYMNRNLELVIPLQYEVAYEFKDGKAEVKLNGEYFYINEKGEIIETIKTKKTEKDFNVPEGIRIRDCGSGFFLVMFKDETAEGEGKFTFHYGYINEDGKILANPIYGYEEEEAYDNDGNMTYPLAMGNMISDEDGPVYEGLAILNLGNRYGYIDNTGKVVVPLVYTAITPFENGVCYARKQDGKWIKINRKDIK